MNRISFKNMQEKSIGLSNNTLKIIAMVSMLIDHIGLMIFPQYKILRIIGRLSFPIFAYMIAEGSFYTRNRKKYFLLIFCMGAGCQAVYAIAMHSLYLNILLTFTLSIATIFSVDNFINKKTMSSLILAITTVLSVIFISVIAPEIFKEQGFRVDYCYLGVLFPVIVYYSKTKAAKIISAAAVLTGMSFINEIQVYSLLAIPFMMLYNGKRGKLNLKYVFYIFYPLHLVVIYLIDSII